MINVHNITKRYGAIEALRGVSFSIEPGEIVGLLGPNGAGKSTAIKIITGFLHPDDGWVEIDGKDVLTDLRAVQARIGYLSENTPLYPELSVQAYLMMIADLRECACCASALATFRRHLRRGIAGLSDSSDLVAQQGFASAGWIGTGDLAQTKLLNPGRADGWP